MSDFTKLVEIIALAGLLFFMLYTLDIINRELNIIKKDLKILETIIKESKE